jgi:CheY-like chemotaxis protein
MAVDTPAKISVPRPTNHMPTFRFRVLFVDDEPPVRITGAAVLEAAGYEVLTAADGLEGLHALDEAQPDLIISDLRMPHMSGFEFLAVVRNRFPQIPTIALSGEYVTDNVPDGLLADTFFQKATTPFQICLAK